MKRSKFTAAWFKASDLHRAKATCHPTGATAKEEAGRQVREQQGGPEGEGGVHKLLDSKANVSDEKVLPFIRSTNMR